MATKIGNRESLAQQLIKELKNFITKGEMKPNEKLPTEQALIEKYGVSRSVVREAIAGLRADGLVITRQGVGAFVHDKPRIILEQFNPVTLQEILHILQLRGSLETTAAALAAKNRTDEDLKIIKEKLDEFFRTVDRKKNVASLDYEFHLAISVASANPYFSKLMKHFGAQIIPHSRIDLYRMPTDEYEFLQSVKSEHEEIYQAIADQDPERASKAMHDHLQRGLERYELLNQENIEKETA